MCMATTVHYIEGERLCLGLIDYDWSHRKSRSTAGWKQSFSPPWFDAFRDTTDCRSSTFCECEKVWGDTHLPWCIFRWSLKSVKGTGELPVGITLPLCSSSFCLALCPSCFLFRLPLCLFKPSHQINMTCIRLTGFHILSGVWKLMPCLDAPMTLNTESSLTRSHATS